SKSTAPAASTAWTARHRTPSCAGSSCPASATACPRPCGTSCPSISFSNNLSGVLMESQFGLANVWLQGDFVTRAVAVLLLGMSLASWIVILIKALDIMKFKKHARAVQTFWHSEDFA